MKAANHATARLRCELRQWDVLTPFLALKLRLRGRRLGVLARPAAPAPKPSPSRRPRRWAVPDVQRPGTPAEQPVPVDVVDEQLLAHWLEMRESAQRAGAGRAEAAADAQVEAAAA